MFFSKKPKPAPGGGDTPRRPSPQSGTGSLQMDIYAAIVAYLHAQAYTYEEDREKFRVTARFKFPTGSYHLHFRARDGVCLLTTLTPYEIRKSVADDVRLLCAYINSKVIAGRFFLDSDEENIFIEIDQRADDPGTFGYDSMSYLLGVMGSLQSSSYMTALEAVSKGYKELGDVLAELEEEG